MQIVKDVNGMVVGAGCWVDGFVPLGREMTLDEEVRKNGLEPVYNRMMRQGNVERAQELLNKYQQ